MAKEILDTIVLVLFVFMLAMFIIGFNKQQIKKHKDRIEQKKEDKIDE